MTGGTAPPEVPGAPHIDLHLHSTASDGATAPEEVVRSAVAAGVHTIALTDHDTVAGVASAREAAANGPVHVVAGVELSAYQGEQEVHLLGLHIADLARLDAGLDAFRVARHQRGVDMVARLNTIGVKITFDDVLSEAKGGAIGRPHVAKAMVENGWARDLRDAFDRYLGAGRPAFLPKKRLTMADAIAMVHACGGLAILAHPGAECNRTRLAALQLQGLDGAEVIHPSHSPEDRRRILEALDALGMVPSGGSDSHGAVEGSRVVGAMRVPYVWLERQLQRVEAQRRTAGTA